MTVIDFGAAPDELRCLTSVAFACWQRWCHPQNWNT